MRALEASDFNGTLACELGDGELRLPGTPYGADGFVAPDGRTLWVSTPLGVAEVDLDAWRLQKLHRLPELASASCTAGLGGARLLTRTPRGVVVWSPGAGEVIAAADDPQLAGKLLARPGRDDEFFALDTKLLTRWRVVGRELRREASFQRPAQQEPFGYGLHNVAFEERGDRMHIQSARDVCCVDAHSLEAGPVSFDINAHHGSPRAWVDVGSLAAIQLHDDALFVLANRAGGNARVYRCSLRDGSVRELPLPAPMALSSMSPVLANGRLLVGGLSGAVAIDAARFEIAEIARGSASHCELADRARSRMHAYLRGGEFITVHGDKGLRVATREGARMYTDLRWNEAHLVALCPSSGVERFTPPAPAPTRLPDTQSRPPGRLSAAGRWALLPRDKTLLIQPTDGRSPRRSVAHEVAPGSGCDAAAVSEDGALWRWTGRQLLSEGGASLALARRDTWGVLSPSRSGRSLVLTTAKEIFVVDPAAPAVRCAVAAPRRPIAAFADDHTLLVAGADGLRWFDAVSGALVQWHKRKLDPFVRIALSHDGSRVALLGDPLSIELVQRDAPGRAARFTAAMGPHTAAFSPDGSQLAVASDESVLRVFSVEAIERGAAPAKKRARPARLA